jgi:serine protease Do
MAKRIMDDLIEDGEVSRGYLGILPADVDQVMAQALDLGDVRGVLISRVEPDTPAEEAGLEAEDVIVSVNGEDLTSGSALSFRNTIAGFKPGEEIELGVIRDGKELELSVTLGERTDDVIAESGSVKEDLDEKLGFRVTELTSDIKRQLSLSNDVQGVIVNKISEASEAAERGLRKGDVITAVKRKKVSTPEEFYKEIEESVEEGDKAILLTVERNNLKQFIAFRL